MSQQHVVGNIADDPELRFTPAGKAVVNFTIAEDRRRFNRQTNEWEKVSTNYYKCSVWREAAENVAESLRKGTRVIACGEVYQERYERQDGTPGMAVKMEVQEVGPSLRYATTPTINSTSRGGGQAQGGGGGYQQPQYGQQPDPWATQPAQGGAPWGGNSGGNEPPF